MALDVTTTYCPPTADLERLVRGRLTEARAAEIADHVGSCCTCQQRLDAISGGNDNITVNLRDCCKQTPPSDSAYYKALAAAEDEVRSTSPYFNGSAESRQDRDQNLDFLQPPDEAGMLGKLGEFCVIRVVGRGGMGVVLHAYDPSLARDVAIKVIDPKLAHNEVARQRFCREARAAAAVTHDNLVAVHQVDEDEHSGLPYLVMQLVQGESLEQRLKRVGRLTMPEVARLGMQAAAGLSAAHAGGLIHRDIKPANILLEDPVDRVKLTDFGLARAAEDVKLTRTGFVAGSPLYMAPEQARGDEIDHRSDLFSLGSVLYEAASGTPAFDGKTPLAVLRRVADETPQPLHTANPDMPEWMSEIIGKLLAKNPGDRYQSAAEVAETFAAELARAHALSPLDVPADICPAVAASRSGMAARSRKHICWKSVAFRTLPWLGGAAIGALAVALLWSPQPEKQTVEIPVAGPPRLIPASALTEHGPAPVFTFDGNAGAIWAVTFLDADRLVVGMEDGNVKIWNFRTNSIVKSLEPRQGGTIWSIDVSSDGKYLVAPSDDSEVAVWKLDTYEQWRRFPQPTATKAAAFSPNAARLATGDRNATVRIWDMNLQIPIELKGHHGTVHALAYSPDGMKLASAASDGTVKIWDFHDFDWLRRDNPQVKITDLAEHKGPVYGVAFSNNGELVATTGRDGTVRIWDAAKGEQKLMINAHDGDAWSVSFGNDGKWVASAGQDAVKVWEVATGKEIFSYHSPRTFQVVRFAKDGTTLAAGGRDGTVKIWQLAK